MSKKYYFTVALILVLLSSFVYAATLGETVAKQNPSISQSAVCGNNVVEEGEECEENDLNQKTCESYGFLTGTLSCKGCILDTSECVGPSTPAAQFVEAPGVKLSPLHLIVIIALIVIIIGGVIYLRKI